MREQELTHIQTILDGIDHDDLVALRAFGNSGLWLESRDTTQAGAWERLQAKGLMIVCYYKGEPPLWAGRLTVVGMACNEVGWRAAELDKTGKIVAIRRPPLFVSRAQTA